MRQFRRRRQFRVLNYGDLYQIRHRRHNRNSLKWWNLLVHRHNIQQRLRLRRLYQGKQSFRNYRNMCQCRLLLR